MPKKLQICQTIFVRFNYSNSQIFQKDIEKTAKKLKDYIKFLNKVVEDNEYSKFESSINLPFDDKLNDEVKRLVSAKCNENLKYIIDIGIGGSNLGTKAIYDSLFGYSDLLEPDRFPKIIFADTIDPEVLEKIGKLLQNKISSGNEVLVNAISKSGTTTETIANLEIILENLNIEDKYSRVVLTTDQGSKLDAKAKEIGITTLHIPKTVGGRFSVFSSVGLFPLLAAGINIDFLLDGARNIIHRSLNDDTLSNPSLISAIILYLQFQNGKIICDNFFFHPEMESVGKWYRQLMGESLGKEKDLKGRTVNSGITPTVSLGSTDLHSMAQLYFGGPKDKITTFVYTSQINGSPTLPLDGDFQILVDGISGKSAFELMSSIYAGVKTTYINREIPYMEVILEDISEKSLGQYLQFKMLEMMYLGKLLNVNTFDQPNVEEYKVVTKKILNSS